MGNAREHVEARWRCGGHLAFSRGLPGGWLRPPTRTPSESRRWTGAIHRDVHSCGQRKVGRPLSRFRLDFLRSQATAQLHRRPHPSPERENLVMATIAFDRSPALSRSLGSAPASFPESAERCQSPAPALAPAPRASSTSCRSPAAACTVLDLPDGSRVGRLSRPDGRGSTRPAANSSRQVSGWFGRSGACGTSWALAFGAGGSHESLEVRFASLRARRVVPVVSDHYGLWVAEVAGAFRAATILSPARRTRSGCTTRPEARPEARPDASDAT